MLDKKIKIVIVDDDAVSLNIIESALGNLYEVHTIMDESRALTEFERIMPDLIIMDIMMPKIDGVSIYIAQKQNPKLEQIPVIFVSAIGDTEYKVQLLEWGVEDYITKPYDIDEVRARVKRQLSRMRK